MVRETRYYEVLQVQPDAELSTIKRSYRRLAKLYHPDKNPETGNMFKEISMVFNVLYDQEKRKKYDEKGEKGLKEDGLQDDADVEKESSVGEIDSILEYAHKKLADLDSDYQNVKIEKLGKFLKQLGDINFQDSMGFSALHLFVMRGWWDGVKLVLKNPEARLDLQTRKGQTALHLVLGNSLEGLNLLCEDRRMSLNILNKKDIDGKTVLQLARDKKNDEAVEFLSETKLRLSGGKKEGSRRKSSADQKTKQPKTDRFTKRSSSTGCETSTDSDETGGKRNFEEIYKSKTDAFNQPGQSRSGEYFERIEPKPKRQKTEAPTEDVSPLLEEWVSLNQTIEESKGKIDRKERENLKALQELLENNKIVRKQVEKDHEDALQASIDKLKAEQKTVMENLEKTLETWRKELEAKNQKGLKSLQEELGSLQRERENIKARLKNTLQDEPEDLPKCPSCELPFDDKMIFSCLEGHTICSDCKPQFQTCQDLECSEDNRRLGYPARAKYIENQIRKLMAGR